MSYFEYVECPYCNKEINVEDIEFDGNDEVDQECPECEKEFEVIREWYPSYSAQEITYHNCNTCKKEYRDNDMYYKNDIMLCRKCYMEELFKEIEMEKTNG